MLARSPGTSALPGKPGAGAQEGCGEGPCGPNAASRAAGAPAQPKGLPSPTPHPRLPPTPRLHEGLLPFPPVAPALFTAWAGRVTTVSSPDKPLLGSCLTGLLSDHRWLEPLRRSARLLWDREPLRLRTAPRVSWEWSPAGAGGQGRSSGALALS